ncbi:hypothetical protein O181_041095 [Austropuccinia psidii MF-1]|uniref:Uncharacterized protein n=1 Tax=Austropuccinia psidii MF-1 TaxID=1389203 RepID=A0A9Q3DI22_9BASI|nr:hypothetical protein [Austropuccinia psidii MF-1]
MRQEHGKHDWVWWKSEIITQWASNSWRFKMENAFESSIFNWDKDNTLTWFLKKKERLCALHPDMSYSMIDVQILRKCGGELENANSCRCEDPCSTEDYINAMEDMLLGQELVKTGLETSFSPKQSQRLLKRKEDLKEIILSVINVGATHN